MKAERACCSRHPRRQTWAASLPTLAQLCEMLLTGGFDKKELHQGN